MIVHRPPFTVYLYLKGHSMHPRRTIILALFVLCTLLPWSGSAHSLSGTPGVVQAEVSPGDPNPGSAAPPALRRSCIRGANPIDFDQVICCVSGYVYLNGAPVVGADVTIALGDRTIQVQTASGPDSAHPYYSASLYAEPLRVQPGDTVTITATAGGQTRSRRFVAQPGGQQVDIVLPQSAVAATWQPGEQRLSARYRHVTAYDSTRQRTVLFGGFGAAGRLADTWEWDGSSWMLQRTPVAPPARAFASMTYDSIRQRVVLFGGDASDGFLADTWEWDGVAWTERTPAVSPSARRGHVLTYDAARQKTILFGGESGDHTNLADTWEWDGQNWTWLEPGVSPAARRHAALSYDSTRQRLVLFGGFGSNMLDDTWEWNGSTWQRRFSPSSPSPRGEHAMAYDPVRQRTILTGGYDGSPLTDAWEWDGSAWIPFTIPFPPRYGHALVYDTARSRIAVTGGHGSQPDHLFDDTWESDGNQWMQRDPRISPPGRLFHAMAYDQARGHLVLFGGFLGSQSDASTWVWDGTTWTKRSPAMSPPALRGHTMVYNPVRQRVILFGGSNSNGTMYYSDIWEWDGTTWNKASSALLPPARAIHTMVYHEARQSLLIFGGKNISGNLTDTWEWNGTTWIQHTPAHAPANPHGAMAYDSLRQRVIYFSGQSETWEWDGTDWISQTVLPHPSAHSGLKMAYDPVHQKSILFGGQISTPTGSMYGNETWQWDGTTWTELSPRSSPPGRYHHAMAYDTSNQTIVLFSGDDNSWPYFADTWLWNDSTWLRYADDTFVPGRRSDAAFSYAQTGQSMLFGGQTETSLDPNTYRWQGNQWQMLTPATFPSARVGTQLVRNSTGSQLLLFGGKDASDTYLNDTWAWQGDTWVQQTPATPPPPRGYAGLTYDHSRQVWVLFGGQDTHHYLGDTWEYDGATWTQRTPATNPPTRSHATLTFDAGRGRAVLVGGQSVEGTLNDVWEWDGTTWVDVTPIQPISPRTGHQAVYDSVNGVVVVVGGTDGTTTFNDTWEWNGSFWTQRVVQAAMPARSHFAMTYDAQRGEIVAFAGKNDTTFVSGTYLHQVIGAVANPLPVATIHRVSLRDARQELDQITFVGSGADADSTDEISAYRWSIGETLISDQPAFTFAATDLPLGEQTIQFAVQDNEGAWSSTVAQRLIIRDKDGRTTSGKTWTLLLYAVADNDLDVWMGDTAVAQGLLYRLRTAGVQPDVQVGVLYDGPGTGDTHLYTLSASGAWSRQPWSGGSEARMDEMQTLRDFIRWGYTAFSTDYYALALLDHANGIVGFGQDLTSQSNGTAFLTPAELRAALVDATDDGARKVDLLFYDGCSFGLFENAAIAHGLAHFVIASPNTGWGVFPYDRYRQLAGQSPDPRRLASEMAQTYAVTVAAHHLPYTISVFDLAHFDQVQTDLSTLGYQLLAYVQGEPVNRTIDLKRIRADTQKYDSGGNRLFEIDQEDSYVDLLDLAMRLQRGIPDAEVIHAAAALETSIAAFLVDEQHASGRFINPATNELFAINLEQAHGIGIYYPPRSTTITASAYAMYITNRLFDSTRDSGWTAFLANGLPALGSGDAPPMPNDVLLRPLLTTDVQAADTDTTTTLTATSGGIITNADGSVQVDLPSGSVTATTHVTYTHLDTPSQPLPAGYTVLRSFRLDAQTSDGQPVTTFQRPYTLILHYTDADVRERDLDETDLTLLAWDGQSWTPLPACPWCRIDSTNNTITVLFDQVGDIVLAGSVRSTPPLQYLFLPLVMR